MVKGFFLSFLFLLFTLFEGIVVSLPLVLVLLLVAHIFDRGSWLFISAFISGIVIDVFLLRPIGVTSLVLLVFLLILFLYEKKFETNSVPFVVFASFMGSILFMIIFSFNHILILGVISVLISLLLYILFSWMYKKTKNSEYYYGYTLRSE